jgi:O-antigen ligase
MRRLSFYLFLVFVFTVPWENAIAIGGNKTLSSLIGVAALVCALLSCLLAGRIARPPAFILAFGVLVGWQLATYFWSVDPMSTLIRVVTMVQLLAMVWLLTELCESERERLQIMQAFVVGCVVVCAVLIQAYLSGGGGMAGGYRYEPAGFNANESADMIAVGIPMALLIATSRGGIRRWLNIGYLPLGVFAVILTASRSGFIATCLGLLSVFFALRHARPLYRMVWLAVILAVFVSLFYGLPVQSGLEANIQRVTFATDTQSLSTFTGRTTIWSTGYQMFTDHPVAGIGFNTFTDAVEESLGGRHAPHSIWIQTAAETGIVGLGLLSLTLVLAFVPSVRWRDFRIGFHSVLFLVLITTSFVANLIDDKGVWIGLAVLSATGAIQAGRRVVDVSYPQVRTCSSMPDRG